MVTDSVAADHAHCTEASARRRGLKFTGAEADVTNLVPESTVELQCIESGYMVRAHGANPASETLITRCVATGRSAYFSFEDKFAEGVPICISREKAKLPEEGEFSYSFPVVTRVIPSEMALISSILKLSCIQPFFTFFWCSMIGLV